MHRKLVYLGKLEGLSEAQKVLLIGRLESLLLYRYEGSCDDDQVESLAYLYFGKLYQRFRKALESSSSEPCPKDTQAPDDAKDADDGDLSPKNFLPLRIREVGGEWVCLQAIKELGIFEFLVEQRGWCKEDADAALMNLQGRLLYPTSESQTEKWLKEQSSASELLEGSGEVKLGHLYKSALKLLEEREVLEDYLYNRIKALLDFKEERYLYDLTNTYFEGRMQGSDLARHGRSKERRGDCLLVSIALLTNELGFIRRSHFYPGNVSEPGTFKDVLDYLKDSKAILTDAGIATNEHVEDLAKQGISYMCVASSKFSEYAPDFDEAEEFDHKASNAQTYLDF